MTLVRILDEAMDWLVLPGYTSIGYRVRNRLFPASPIDLTDKSVMVTGASGGIGEAACSGLASLGAKVHMVVRNRERGERAIERLVRSSGSTKFELHLCDVSLLSSVRKFTASFLSSGDRVDVLINNAGVLPPKRASTDEGIELTFATNVLGPFLLTALLLPALRRSAPSRVTNVSSGGMYTSRVDVDDIQLKKRDYDGPRFYAHTKRAEVILTEEWARRLKDASITVHSMHPGWAATPGVASSLPRFNRVLGPLLRDAHAGADTIVWLAGASEAARTTGEFWHDRKRRPKHRVPWTRETAEERSRLFAICQELSGSSDHDLLGTPGRTDVNIEGG